MEGFQTLQWAGMHIDPQSPLALCQMLLTSQADVLKPHLRLTRLGTLAVDLPWSCPVRVQGLLLTGPFPSRLSPPCLGPSLSPPPSTHSPQPTPFSFLSSLSFFILFSPRRASHSHLDLRMQLRCRSPRVLFTTPLLRSLRKSLSHNVKRNKLIF